MKPTRKVSHLAELARTGKLAAVASGCAACGGGAALLHPAHTLDTAQVTAGAGVSNQFAFGPLDTAIETGRTASTPGTVTADNERAVVEGAVADFMAAPGVAPWVGARVGLGRQFEGGLTYQGRTTRVDGRYAFEQGAWALSLGAGASFVLGEITSDPEPGGELPSARTTGGVGSFTGSGVGFDLPLLLGWRSSGEVIQAWLGARGGYETIRGELPLAFAPPAPQPDDEGEPALAPDAAAASASRWHAGGLAGLAVGVQPIWVAVEVNAAYQSIQGAVDFPPDSGDPERRSVDVSGWTVSPAGALIVKF